MSCPCQDAIIDKSIEFTFGRLTDIYTSVTTYNKNLKKLDDKCALLKGKMKDIDNDLQTMDRLKELTDTTKIWLNQVNQLMEKTEFKNLTDVSKRKANDVWCCGSIHRYNVVHRYKSSKAAIEMITEIQEKLATDVGTVEKNIRDLEPVPNEFDPELKSRNDLLQQILHKLMDDKVDAVAICGMGGAGKTTLANELEKIGKDRFDLIARANMSEAPVTIRIQQELADSIGFELNKKSEDARAKLLLNRLELPGKNKKLFILDNIWEATGLEKFGIPDRHKVKILYVSREKDVCREMGVEVENVIPVPTLVLNEARLLFRNYLGKKMVENVGEYECVYKPVEDKLLRHCDGLPLAIKISAKGLTSTDLSYWELFLDDLNAPMTNEKHTKGVRDYRNRVIETSLKFLGEEKVKIFFLLTCLYPPGIRVPLEDLVRYGIGLNLFRNANDICKERQRAKIWVDDLRSSSLILDHDRKYDTGGSTLEYVSIHDVVRSSGLYQVKGVFDMLVVPPLPKLEKKALAEYAAISVTGSGIFPQIHELMVEESILRSKLQMLVLRGNSDDEEFQHKDFFKGMTDLKVLHISGVNFGERIPESMGELKNLKVLILEKCQLGDITLIGKLKELLVLSLQESNTNLVPDDIRQLTNLRLLYLGCNESNKFGNPGNLGKLEGAYANSLSQLESFLGQLESLKRLKELGFEVSSISQLPTGVEFVDCLKALNRFAISVGTFKDSFFRYDPEMGTPNPRIFHTELLPRLSCYLQIMRETKADVLKSRCLTALLKITDSLFLEEVSGLEIFVNELDEDGFKHLKHLTIKKAGDLLYIFDVSSCKKDMRTVLSNVQRLCLVSCRKLKRIFRGVAPERMLCNLRTLSLVSLPNLVSYNWPSKQAHNLISIEVKDCEKLSHVFRKQDFESSILPALQSINLSGLASLKVMLDGTEEGIVEILPSLEHITLTDLPKLQALMGTEASSSSTSTSTSTSTDYCSSVCQPLIPTLKLHSKLSGEIREAMAQRSKVHRQSSFQNLKTMSIFKCDKIHSLCMTCVAAHLVQLETLSISTCSDMQELLTNDSEAGKTTETIVVFPKLSELRLIGLHNLKSLYRGSRQLQFKALKMLMLQDLSQIVHIAGSEKSMALFCTKIEFPFLEQLKVTAIRKKISTSVMEKHVHIPLICCQEFYLKNEQDSRLLKEKITTKPAALCFRNLKTMSIENCDKLHSLCSSNVAAQFVQLETLSLRKCQEMTELFTNQTEDLQICQPVGVFPNLTDLNLFELNNLKSFYEGALQLEFSALKILSLEQLPKIVHIAQSSPSAAFFNNKIRFPCLEQLTMKSIRFEASEKKEIWCPNHIPNLLRYLNIWGAKGLQLTSSLAQQISKLELGPSGNNILISTSTSTSASSSLGLSKSNLEEVKIWHDDIAEDLFTKNKATTEVIFSQVRLLELTELKKLSPIPLHLFKNIMSMVLCSLSNWEYIFEPQLVDKGYFGLQLPLLEELTLIELRALKEVIRDKFVCEVENNSKAVKIFKFPQLKNIQLFNLPEVVSFCSQTDATFCFPSLESVRIERCDKLQSFCSGHVTAPSLKLVSLLQCDQMKAFSNANLFPLPLPDSLPHNHELQPFLSGNLGSNPAAGMPKESEVHKRPSFRNLKTMYLDYCDKIQSLCQPSVAALLVQLETLRIKKCTDITVLFINETKDEQISKLVGVFPKLTNLDLIQLDNLKSFYEGVHQLEFKALKTLLLEHLPKIIHIAQSDKNSTAFFNEKITFPCLEQLKMMWIRSATPQKEIWCSNHIPKSLRHLEFWGGSGLQLTSSLCQQLSKLKYNKSRNRLLISTSTSTSTSASSSSVSPKSNLEELQVGFDDILEVLITENEATAKISCSQVRVLELTHLKNLKKIPFIEFSNIMSLKLHHLNLKYVFEAPLIDKGISLLLPLLKEVIMSEMKELKLVIQDTVCDDENNNKLPVKDIGFPRLKTLQLFDLPEVIHFCSRANVKLCFPSLEVLRIDKCDKFLSFCSGQFTAPTLKSVELIDCCQMKEFSDVEEFPLLLPELPIVRRCPKLVRPFHKLLQSPHSQ